MNRIPNLTNEQLDRVREIAVRTVVSYLDANPAVTPEQALDCFLDLMRARYPEIYIAVGMSSPEGRAYAYEFMAMADTSIDENES